MASTASDRKGAQIQHAISWFYLNKSYFKTSKIKLNSRTWLPLKSSVVIFQALEPLQPQWPLQPQQPQWPQWPQQPHFIKKITRSAALMILGTKMTNTGPFLWNRWSKIQIFTDFSIFFAGGCWGQPMLFFLKTDLWNSNFQTSWSHQAP